MECQAFVEDTVTMVLRTKPSLVILSSHNHYSAGDGSDANGTVLALGVVSVAKRIIAAGIPVLGFKGTPTLTHKVPECWCENSLKWEIGPTCLRAPCRGQWG